MKKRLSIIILSDDLSIAEDIKAALQDEKYLLMGVIRRIDDAIDLVPLVKPDLAIAGQMFHGGINGIDAAEKLNTFYNMPVIFITTEDVKWLIPRIRITQCYSFLEKPFTRQELLHAIDITYKNFTCSFNKEELMENTKALKGSIEEKIKEVTERLTHPEGYGVVRQLSDLFNEINETFQNYAFGKDISLAILRRNGDVVYANSNFAALCGITLEDLTGQNIFRYINARETMSSEEIPQSGGAQKNKGFFFNCSVVHPEKGTIRLCSYMDDLKDSCGKTFVGLVAVEKELKQELIKLLERVDINLYVHGLIETNSFLKGLKQALADNELLKRKDSPELEIKFHKSISSLIGYAEQLANETDNLSYEEIKDLAGKINAYLKVIYSLSQDEVQE
jgi:AmiR/NasT family two-component response regulator